MNKPPPKPQWSDAGIGKIPPNDPESEKGLIGAILNDTRNLFNARSLLDDGDVFYQSSLQELYVAILAVFDAGLTVRLLTVTQHLRRQGKESILEHWPLAELTSQGYGVDVMTTALYLRELYIQRLIIAKAGELIQSVFGHEPLDAQIALSQQLADMMSGKMAVAVNKPISHYVALSLMQIKAAAKSETGLVGVNTGSGKINKLTGGWRKKKFIVIGGRPASGKTAIAICHAIAAAKSGAPVAFLSGEMPGEELTNRMISSECDIPYKDLEAGKHDDGREFSLDDWKKISKAAGIINNLPIHIYNGDNYDIANIIYWILDMIRQHGVQLAILDYVQLFDDRTLSKNADTTARVASVSRKLRLFATTADLPVIVLAQLGRQVDLRENRRPLLTDLKESGQLEQDADIVIGLYRNDYYEIQDAKKKPVNGRIIMPELTGWVEYDFLKFRGSSPRMIKLYVDIGCNQAFDDKPFVPASNSFPVAAPAMDPNYLSSFPTAAVAKGFLNGGNSDDNQETPF